MTDFAFTPLVNDSYKDIVSTGLGDGADKFTDKDMNKLVTLSTATPNSHDLCASGDEIRGMIVAIEPATVNSGISFGSVQRDERIKVSGTGFAVGDLVVADAQEAVGTVLATGYPGVIAGTPANFKWEVIRVIDATTFLIEKI